jgi:putative phage-type endonuclease
VNRQIIQFKTEDEWLAARVGNINSTEAAALFHLSPYLTRMELYYRLAERSHVTIEATERMKLGARLESAIAEEAAERNGWKIRPMKDYRQITDLRLGSSFDYEIVEPFHAILECKNVDGIQFKQNWDEDDQGNTEATPQIEIQVQHQMLVSGIDRAFIAVLVGGNTIKTIERDQDLTIQKGIKDEAAALWKMVDAHEPPPIDFDKDASFVIKRYGFAEPGKVLAYDSGPLIDLAVQHKLISDQLKELEARKEALKAEMLFTIGDAEKIKCPGFSITAGLVGPCQMNYTRNGYRNFRINWPRKKA